MIYLDNNASTPIDPRVADAIKEELAFQIDNPSSLHQYGQGAKIRLEKARRQIADTFGVKNTEVIFTSSGTESLNLLIRGALKGKKGHIITSQAEHPAVFNLIKSLDYDTTYLTPDSNGIITSEDVTKAIRPDTLLVALMAVNNETGVKTDIHAIADAIKVPLIVDGVQWLGKEKIALPKNLFGIGFSGHKIHAPPGIGFAIIKQPIAPTLIGGAQEFGKRGGTENMLGIAALRKAIEILEFPSSAPRDAFESILIEKLPIQINGKNRVGTTSNITFPNVDGETLLIKLDQAGIAASLGSACSSGAIEPSRVLLAMGLSYKEAKSSLRFSFSRMNTVDEAKRAAQIVIDLIK